MPVRKSFASQKVIQCPEVPIAVRLEAARYLLRWADGHQRPRISCEASIFLFQHSEDIDERLSRALYFDGE